MAGYTRIFDKDPGDRIDAEDFNDEYQLLTAAFTPSGHSHDGTAGNGGYVPFISDADKHNAVETNSTLNQITMSVEASGVAQTQLILQDGKLIPAVTGDVDLGTPANKFGALHATTITTTTLEFLTGAQVNVIHDEDDFASDSSIGLATQQSIKAYVDTATAASPGIFLQSKFVRRASDQALTGAMADYVTITITVEEQSSIIAIATVSGSAENNPGSVLAHIYLDGTTELGSEDTYVTNPIALTTGEVVYGSATMVESTGPLAAGTYDITIKLREQGTDGTALNANLLLLEESA